MENTLKYSTAASFTSFPIHNLQNPFNIRILIIHEVSKAKLGRFIHPNRKLTTAAHCLAGSKTVYTVFWWEWRFEIIKYLNCAHYDGSFYTKSIKSLLCISQNTLHKRFVPTCPVAAHVHWRTPAKNSFQRIRVVVMYTRGIVLTFCAIQSTQTVVADICSCDLCSTWIWWWHVR
jgi:hypothetical protein